MHALLIGEIDALGRRGLARLAAIVAREGVDVRLVPTAIDDEIRDAGAVLAAIERSLDDERPAVVVLSGHVSASLAPPLARLFRAHEVRPVVDAGALAGAGAFALSLAASAALVVGSASALREIVGVKIETPGDARVALERLVEAGARSVAIVEREPASDAFLDAQGLALIEHAAHEISSTEEIAAHAAARLANGATPREAYQAARAALAARQALVAGVK